jgi:hypothetical protein
MAAFPADGTGKVGSVQFCWIFRRIAQVNSTVSN